MSTSAEERRVVVVGAGEAGARVAHELHTGGWTGSITLVGEEGRPPYERPPLSKATLVDDDPRPVEPYRDGRLDLPGLEVVTARSVVTVDPDAHEVGLSDGSAIGYDCLVLATGARSRRLPGLPEGVLTLRTYEDALALREVLLSARRLLVVGAGLIGLEVAASARTKGVDVTVVEAGPRALGRAVPEPVAQVLVDRHLAEGVDLRVGTTIAELTQVGSGWTAQLSDGTAVSADAVLQAVGSVPETTLAQAAGLAVDDGIVVDGQMRTSEEDIWAVGDCCSGPVPPSGGSTRLESWRMAHDQAVTAAAAIRGEDVIHDAIPWFWSDQYDLTLQVAGMASAATTWVERPRPDGTTVHLGLDADGRLVCAAGAGRAAVAKDVRMAEKLIAVGRPVDPAVLADPEAQLRSLLRA